MNVALLSLVLLTPASEDLQSRCEALLGDVNMTESNRARRGARLFEVNEGERSREVIHAVSNWRAPKSLRLAGIRLREIVDTGADAPAWRRRLATVEMKGGPCPDGLYTVGVDDALGKKRSVVAVLEDRLLVDVDGELREVKLPSAAALAPVRLVWRSPFAVTVAGGSSAPAKKSSSSSSSKPSIKRDGTNSIARNPAQAALERRDRAKARAAKRKAKKGK